jgi:short-subunit dehydrogenase
VEDSPLKETRYLFDVNFFGIIDLTQRVLPHMRKAKSGLIVNMSSICGKLHSAFESSYVASKHALEGWSDCLRVEAWLFNVQVAIIEPGYIKSDIHEGSADYTPADSFYKDLSDACYRHTVGHCQDNAHDPSVVADALIHAVESGRPKRRYVMGYMARYVAIRKWFGDHVYDRLIR